MYPLHAKTSGDLRNMNIMSPTVKRVPAIENQEKK